MGNFLFLTGGNRNSASAYQLFASCKGGETAGSVARNSSFGGSFDSFMGGETAGSVASSSTCGSASTGSSCSFSAIA